jgi:single-strand DNA-binding protein
MADINHVVLVGRLTRNAELKYTGRGAPVAVNQRRKKDDQWIDEANFFDVVLWGKSAESLAQYLVKGKQVGIEGQLRQDRWEQDGQSRSRVEIVASNVMLLGGRASGAEAPGAVQGGKDFPEGQAPDNFQDDIPF